jgi:hypothetical protein
MMTLLISVVIVGWVAAAVLGTQAYFRGEQTKPIHARNWRSAEFEQLAKAITGADPNSVERTPGFDVSDAYTSGSL